jgi:hypothetical protein
MLAIFQRLISIVAYCITEGPRLVQLGRSSEPEDGASDFAPQWLQIRLCKSLFSPELEPAVAPGCGKCFG